MPTRFSRRSETAFTLLEILVVIAIIAVLAAVLFPVFAQARAKARGAVALSNSKQLACGCVMYAQDYDEGLPLTYHAGNEATWIETIQPYVKNRLVYRLADDKSTNWNTPLAPDTRARKSSYATNAYVNSSPTALLPLAEIDKPSETIFIAEYRENKAGDHIHPMCWPPQGCLSASGRSVMEPVSDTHRVGEIEDKRFAGGAHYVFCDGHAKWHKFEQTYNPAQRRDWYAPNAAAAAKHGR